MCDSQPAVTRVEHASSGNGVWPPACRGAGSVLGGAGPVRQGGLPARWSQGTARH